MKIDWYKLNNLNENRKKPFVAKGRYKTNDFVRYIEKNKEKIEKTKNNQEIFENIIPYYLNLNSVNDISKSPIELEETLILQGITEDNNFAELLDILYFIESNISSIDKLDFKEKDNSLEKLTSTLLKVKRVMEEIQNNNDLMFTTIKNKGLTEGDIELFTKKLADYISKESRFSNEEENHSNELEVNNKEQLNPKVFLLNKNEGISIKNQKDPILVKEKSEGSIYYNLEEVVEESDSVEYMINNKYNLEKMEELDTEEIIDESSIIDGNKGILFENRPVLGSKFNSRNIDDKFIDKKDIVNHIVEKTKLIIDENKPEIQVKLKPEFLGELILEVEVKEGFVLAKALVENYKTKKLIETNIIELREKLGEQGLKIKTFEVSIGSYRDFQHNEREGFTNNTKPKFNKVIVKDKDVEKVSVFYEDSIEHESLLGFGNNTIDLMA